MYISLIRQLLPFSTSLQRIRGQIAMQRQRHRAQSHVCDGDAVAVTHQHGYRAAHRWVLLPLWEDALITVIVVTMTD